MGDFRTTYQALTTYQPLRWQSRLHREFLAGTFRPVCSLPTGLGKTSVIPIWLIALAEQTRTSPRIPLPRRLVYIVNRRTVVDQATELAEQLRRRLQGLEQVDAEAEGALRDMRDSLSRLAATDSAVPVAISTLRGELADNSEWKNDPARPAIIIGTIDMIGSRLLFQGYGDSRYFRPHHAGLLGQDTLIIHDEAHLTPAFGQLIREVATIQHADNQARPVRVMELSATIPPGGSQPKPGDVFALTDEDRADQLVRDRINARKRLLLHSVADRKAVVAKIVEIARAHSKANCRVLIYVRSPEDAKAVKKALCEDKKAPVSNEQVELLTGTLRGFERDELAGKPLFRWFRGEAPLPHTGYLVSTSAGEVGADLDADHMVCDLTTLESMIQRLGRVNRRGQGSALVDVVVEEVVEQPNAQPPKGEGEDLFRARQATWKALGELPLGDDARRDASPGALRAIADRTDAWGPQPQVHPLTDILLDGWALTALPNSLPGLPGVQEWLHGIQPPDPPETYVVWRKELSELARANVPTDVAEQALDAFPIRSAERLREPSWSVHKQLQAIARRHPDAQALLIGQTVSWRRLSDLAAEDPKQRLSYAYATIVLPTGVGGLRDGYLDGDCEPEVPDVAEAARGSPSYRQRVRIDSAGEHSLLGDEPEDGLVTRFRIALSDDEFAADGGEGETRTIEYRVARSDANALLGAGEATVRLEAHTNAVVECAERLAAKLGLMPEEAGALRLAAQWHDHGKDRPIWQDAAGNHGGAVPLAKSGKRGLNGRALQGYRHEFGSLLDAADAPEVRAHPESDLILHLIAAHHGWARPHFEPAAHDNSGSFTSDQNQDAVVDAMRRYARLQLRFGRWGLAWLEAMLRCADAMASRQTADGSEGGMGVSPMRGTSLRDVSGAKDHGRNAHATPTPQARTQEGKA